MNNVAEMRIVEGIGRDVLTRRIAALCDEVEQLRTFNTQLNENVGAVQARCTELLEQVRTLLACCYPLGKE